MAHPNPDRIIEVGLGFWASKALLTAVEMGLFTELAREPGDAAALRERLGLHARSVHDFLDALVALDFLERDEDGVYRNTPATAAFLDRGKPGYVGGILEMASARLYPFWHRLGEALRSGRPQNEIADGGDFFATLYADPDRLAGFLHAMTGVSHTANRLIAERLPWSDYTSFVDVGTAQGNLAVQVAKTNDHLRGVGFDLPPVEPHFSDYVARHGLAGRLRFMAGDFFADPLPEADVILMGHILHDWGVDEKRMLIAKAHDALPAGGALAVYDTVIDDERRSNAFGLLMSLNMLIETPAGFDYTGAECCEWMRQAGFREARVEPLHGPDSMVLAIK